MKINVVTVGNLKEKYLVEACKEYQKRLSRYHTFNIIEVEEERLPKNYSDADISKALVKEGQRIEKYLSGYVIILDLQGKQMDSVEFSKTIEKISLSSDTITFVIGGSYGMSAEVKARASMSLCFSKMTFPHQLFRVMLLEQLYRATAISNNILYHK
ncbi:MAG: 23S rRNA (pseudouridine(1915)-N(3))-methyltransferase RlmH [Clostridiales bacterium]|nr:23S rRNA (pseudouridine(1915)-N(3))-methyltransferase RlmH [Clostridiales bacterium]